MAVTILSIIGAVIAAIIGLVALVLLPLVSKGLKGLNSILDERSTAMGGEILGVLDNVRTAERELESFAAANESLRNVLAGVSSGMDRLISFLESNIFQVGFPLLLSTLLLLLALPRGLISREKKRGTIK